MTEQPPQDPNQPKPGWYADPGGDQTLRRWWDGRGWAAQTQPMPGTAGPQPPYPGQQPGYLPPGQPTGPVPPPGRGRKAWPVRHKVLTSVLSVVALFAIIGIAAGASGGSGVSTTPAGNVASTVPDGTASARAAASPAATHKAAVARVGSYFDIPGEDGGTYRVTLDKIIDPATAADEFSLPDNGNRYAAALFSVKALSGSLSTEDANDDAEVIGDDGQSYNPSFSDIAGYTNFDDGVIHVAQGDTVKGIVNFEIPAEVKVAKVQWSSGGFGATVQWVVGGS